MKFLPHGKSEVVRSTVKFVLRTSEVDFARRQNQLFGQRPHSFGKTINVKYFEISKHTSFILLNKLAFIKLFCVILRIESNYFSRSPSLQWTMKLPDP